jgi:predicted phage terminase large subunit-like protein
VVVDWEDRIETVEPAMALCADPAGSASVHQRKADVADPGGRINFLNPIDHLAQRPPGRLGLGTSIGHAHLDVSRDPMDLAFFARPTLEVGERIVQSWDTANKATELSDYSVCTTWGIAGKQLYLLGLFRRRLEYPALKRAVCEQQSLYNANVVLIEDKASGTQLIQELIIDGCHSVTRYQPECDKIMRLHAQTAMIENGFVDLPETAPWLAEYLHEITTFPKGKHDDQVDSTAQFLDWFKMPFPGQAIFELYRRQFEQLQPPDTRPVCLRAPIGDRVAADIVGPTHHDRTGRHCRDVRRGRRRSDRPWLDQTR